MRELLPYLKLYSKHKLALGSGILLAILTLLSSVGLLTLSGWFLTAAGVAGLSVAKLTFNYMLPSGGVRGLAMSRTAGRWAERVVSHNATFKLLTELRLYFFEKLARLLPNKHPKFRDSDLLNRLIADVEAMDHLYLRLISPMLVGLLSTLAVTLFLCYFDNKLGLTLGAILLAMLIILPVIFYQLGQKSGVGITNEKAQLRTNTLDWLEGYSELSIFGAEDRYRQRIIQSEQALFSAQRHNAHLTGLSQAILILLASWTLLLMLWLAGDGVNGLTQDPKIALVVFATMASFEIIMPIANAFQHLGKTIHSAKRLNQITQATPDVQFNDHDIEHSDNYSIIFNNVSFRYTKRQSRALRHIELSIKAGEKVAIVGQTGSGKSTLIQLLSRYWDPTQGEIMIANTPLIHWSEKQLREAITVVSQRVDILNGTLRDNLSLANEHACDKTLCDVLQQVGLEALLDSEQGLDSWLGDGGRQLSGGEKRRIGLARMLLRNTPIVLLDEPTEGLDKQTEAQVMTILENYLHDKTAIFITHRLANLNKMDKICLLEQGEVVEYGQHSELMANRGRYYQLTQILHSS